jgi:hypothetical protein
MASTTTAPIPLIITGRTETVGKSVIEALKPECEVVHFTLASAIEDELPRLLRNDPPASPSSTLGTGNWATPPRALLIGGAYSDEAVAELRALVARAEAPGVRGIPWLRVDTGKTAADAAAQGPPGPEYGAQVAARAKEALARLEAEGKLVGGESETYFF